MAKFNSVKAFFETEIPKDIARFIDKNLDISQQVYHSLKQKNWTQSDFAKALGKSTAEVSKWLSGTHNLTLKSIAKMEAVLDTDIILTVKKAEEKYQKINYKTVKKPANLNRVIDKPIEGFVNQKQHLRTVLVNRRA